MTDFCNNNGAINTPIYNLSTVIFPTLEDYFEAEKGKTNYYNNVSSQDCSYGSSYNPTTINLQKEIMELENADASLILPSGLSAITVAILAVIKSGESILIPDSVYYPAKRFSQYIEKKFNIECITYPANIGSNIVKYVKKNTKILFTESPGSWTFEVQDISLMSKAVKSINENIIVMLDNSWATPVFFKTYDNGVDITIHALTKYINGHSDVILGAITCRKQYYQDIFNYFLYSGSKPSPNECFLVSRGLKTLETRLDIHYKNGLEIAKYLSNHSKILRVLHPALDSCIGHDIWKENFTGSASLFSVIIDKKHDFQSICNFVNSLNKFNIGASWGGFNSLVLSKNILGSRKNKLELYGDVNNYLIRFYIGLEKTDMLIEDLEQSLSKL